MAKTLFNGAKWLLAIAAVIGVCADAARAQNTGVIEGTITDEQGGVLPGVTVTLKNIESGAERTAVTDAAAVPVSRAAARHVYGDGGVAGIRVRTGAQHRADNRA